METPKNPINLPLLRTQAAHLCHQRHYLRAITALDALILEQCRLEISPCEVFCLDYFGRGFCYSRLKQTDKAIADFDSAINMSFAVPTIPQAVLSSIYYNRASAFFLRKEYDRAIRDATVAIAHDGNKDPAYSRRGAAHREKGEFQLAIADHDMAIQLRPTRSIYVYSRGKTYYVMGRSNMALRDFSRSLELDPSHFASSAFRGAVHLSIGNYSAANVDLSKAIEADSTDKRKTSDRLWRRAFCHCHLEQFQNATEDLQLSYRLHPNFAEIQPACGRFCNLGTDFLRFLPKLGSSAAVLRLRDILRTTLKVEQFAFISEECLERALVLQIVGNSSVALKVPIFYLIPIWNVNRE